MPTPCPSCSDAETGTFLVTDGPKAGGGSLAVGDFDGNGLPDLALEGGRQASVLLDSDRGAIRPRISGTHGCARGVRAAATVRGRLIRSVRFDVDGRHAPFVGASGTFGGVYRFTVRIPGPPGGRHAIHARVRFFDGETTTLTRRFRRC